MSYITNILYLTIMLNLKKKLYFKWFYIHNVGDINDNNNKRNKDEYNVTFIKIHLVDLNFKRKNRYF